MIILLLRLDMKKVKLVLGNKLESASKLAPTIWYASKSCYWQHWHAVIIFQWNHKWKNCFPPSVASALKRTKFIWENFINWRYSFYRRISFERQKLPCKTPPTNYLITTNCAVYVRMKRRQMNCRRSIDLIFSKLASEITGFEVYTGNLLYRIKRWFY